MLIQKLIIKVYSSLLRRISSIIVPASLLLLLLSALGIKQIGVFKYFSYLIQTHVHIYGGIVLILGLILLGYDNLIKSKGRKRKKIKQISRFNLTPSEVIDYLFYGLLMLLCLSGGVMYVDKYLHSYLYLYKLKIIILHEMIGIGLLSLALVKYYLTLTKWYKGWIQYLKGF